MAFASQLARNRFVVLSYNKQNTYGTALADVNLTHRMFTNAGDFARTHEKEFFTDLEKAKGHPWASFRQELLRRSGFSMGGLELYSELAGWICALLFGKVVTTGTTPKTHTFTPDLSTTISPVSTMVYGDTADVIYKMQDLAVQRARFQGGPSGPLTADVDLIGSGRSVDGAFTPPALVTPTILMSNNSDILLGAPSSAVSIKERVRGWSVEITANHEDYRHPGSGLFAGFTRRGDLRVNVQLSIAAKDTDDIRTLFINDTLQELQINTSMDANNQFNLKVPNLKFSSPGGALESVGSSGYVLWNLTADDSGILKGAALELIECVAINTQATYLVGA